MYQTPLGGDVPHTCRHIPPFLLHCPPTAVAAVHIVPLRLRERCFPTKFFRAEARNIAIFFAQKEQKMYFCAMKTFVNPLPSRRLLTVLAALTILLSPAPAGNHASALPAPAAAGAADSRPFTIPAVRQWRATSGQYRLGPQSRIVVTAPELGPLALRLASDLQTLTGLAPAVVHARRGAAGDILLQLQPQTRWGAEAYTIDISPRGVTLRGTQTGILHATQTLLQLLDRRLLPATPTGTLPCGHIADSPDYPLRGMVLDCGRKYIPMDYLRRLVRTMAYYKLNTLSLHLNDNGFPTYFHDDWNETYAAFRLESERFPGLTAEDGHYTKAEFRQFVLDAAELGVEIIPEIDVPAHSLAFSHYRPSLGSKEFGMDHLDLANPAVIPFVDSLFAEYIDGTEPVFAGPRVHIGTDEYSNRRQETVEQFRALTDHLIHQIETRGKQAAVWGALTHAKGQTPVKVDNVLMYDWYNGYAEPDSMHRLGYHLVSVPDGMTYIVPAAGYYYDYLNIPNLYKNWTPANIGGHHFAERDPQIEGGMFAVWNDIIGNGIAVADIHHRTFPALQVIAEKTWRADTVRTCSQWQRLAATLGEAPGTDDLGRHPAGIVLEAPVVAPGSSRPLPHIGWPYRVSFDIQTPATAADPHAAAGDATAEARGTALFRHDSTEFYLADPITGRIGFARDGYLFTFRHTLRPGTQEHIAVEGDHRETRLYIDGRLVETLRPDTRLFPKNKPFTLVRTLRFPLRHTDSTLRSHVTHLRVENTEEGRRH